MKDLLPVLFVFLWCIMAVVVVTALVKKRRHTVALLTSGSAYYRTLPVRKQRIFRQRVDYFLLQKEFHGRGLQVTREMEVLVAACAVQLTFGLPKLALEHFTRIVIYRDRYRSRLTGNEHFGEVNPGMRAIVISWKHFLADYAVPDNARNLGLHEMAHALWFENRIPNGEHNFLDPAFLGAWLTHAQEEAKRIHAGRSRLFRAYAGTNQEEFFAVAVEYFFEQPEAFCREMPELYQVLADLLKQDPATAAAEHAHMPHHP